MLIMLHLVLGQLKLLPYQVQVQKQGKVSSSLVERTEQQKKNLCVYRERGYLSRKEGFSGTETHSQHTISPTLRALPHYIHILQRREPPSCMSRPQGREECGQYLAQDFPWRQQNTFQTGTLASESYTVWITNGLKSLEQPPRTRSTARLN